MESLHNVHAISSFIITKDEDQLKEALQDAHTLIKEKLQLPDDILLSGLRFTYNDSGSHISACQKMCTGVDPQGHVVVYCCRP